MNFSPDRKLTAIIAGAGHRALKYASYAIDHPEELQITGIADPSELRRRKTAEKFNIPPDMCFESAEKLAESTKLADFIINGTMDHQHVPTSLPLLRRGYDILLEKPFATSEEEMWELVTTARKHGNKVVICHVLRHAPFYRSILEKVREGAVGEILNIQASEHVAYHHTGAAYVRGKWNRKEYCRSTMLMAKSCHDLDIIAWLKEGVFPARVSSFGGNFQFRPEKAPPRSGTRCLIDCPVEKECLYSARKHYIGHPDRWGFYTWESLEHVANPTIAEKIESLKTSRYGGCVWKTDMDVVDHQSVLIEFEDGCTATLNMIGGASRASRAIHITGTRGEIQGSLGDSKFTVRHIDPSPGKEYSEEVVALGIKGDVSGAFGGHGGGDMRLVADFLKCLRGEQPSISTTGLENSISGHLMGFYADRSMEEKRTLEFRSDRLKAVAGGRGALPAGG